MRLLCIGTDDGAKSGTQNLKLVLRPRAEERQRRNVHRLGGVIVVDCDCCADRVAFARVIDTNIVE